MHPLQKNDFPLIVVGANVYRRTMSSPLFTAPSPALAEDIALRLNRDDESGQAIARNPLAMVGDR